jgi:tetratricopeptide (TPR) repeat protein
MRASNAFLTQYLLLLALTLLLAPCSRAASLVCHFADEQGKSLRNVASRLTPTGSEVHQFGKSDNKGDTTFMHLNAGSYELLAQLKDHAPLKWTVQVSSGDQTLELTLMSRKAYSQMEKEVADALNAQLYSKAVALLDSPLKVYPQDPGLHDDLARAYAGMLEELKALAEADKAAQLAPQFAGTKTEIQRTMLRARGEKALQNQDFAMAAGLFEKWTKLDPQNGQAYYALALAYGHQQDFKLALAAIDKALEIEPSNISYSKVKAVLEAHLKGN